MNDVERQIQLAIHGRSALKHIENICEFGDRFTGTEGDQKTLEYGQKHFEKLGLEIEHTKIKAISYQEKEVELTLTDTGTKLEAITPYYTQPCKEGVEGELVYLEAGREEDYKGKNVEGKIVVLNESATGWDWFWLGSFVKRAADHGAVGLVIIHPFPWPNRMSMEAGNLNIKNRFLDKQVPSVCISGLDGLKLMHHLGEGKGNALLKVDTALTDVEAVILSGVIEGSQWPEERIALIGHRDSPIPLGANDNGSGIGSQLEIATALSKLKPKRSIEFIFSTAEEGVSPGVYEYCQIHKDRLPNMKALINIDMVAVGGTLYLVDGGQWHDSEPFQYSSWLMEKIEGVADELGYHVSRMTATSTSEEIRFHEHGVPVAAFWKADDYHYHSLLDTPEKVDANTLKVISEITAITMWRLANEELGK
jgi:hypothetical protein